ncbi:MAG: aminoacyl-tRNA hydrolase [Candidatus Doudnabacteria bacterium]|nr:aminoacyl-tRNA hydrolase [Candidatus Doudnabacteria bacterium]
METFDISKIRLIVGLGNIGLDYARTRHNAGFQLVNKIWESQHGSEWKEQSSFKSNISTIRVADHPVILCLPNTMMNNSGEAVSAICKYFQIFAPEVLVCHDDLDISVGEFKIQLAKGPKVHNGLRSIEKILKTDNYWRVRIGIENRPVKGNSSIAGMDYALGRFTTEEDEMLNKTYEEIVAQLFGKNV